VVLKSSKNGLFVSGEFGVAVHEVGPCMRWDRLLSENPANKILAFVNICSVNIEILAIFG